MTASSLHPTARRLACLTAAATLTLAVTPSLAGAARVTHRHVVKVVTLKGYGRVLETLSGHVLYTYGRDGRNRSRCYGTCIAIWPALKVPAHTVPTGTAGLGVFQRAKGVFQVSFRGRPLYLFVSDTRANEVKGNHVTDFVVASLTGVRKAVKKHAPTTSTTSGYGY